MKCFRWKCSRCNAWQKGASCVERSFWVPLCAYLFANIFTLQTFVLHSRCLHAWSDPFKQFQRKKYFLVQAKATSLLRGGFLQTMPCVVYCKSCTMTNFHVELFSGFTVVGTHRPVRYPSWRGSDRNISNWPRRVFSWTSTKHLQNAEQLWSSTHVQKHTLSCGPVMKLPNMHATDAECKFSLYGACQVSMCDLILQRMMFCCAGMCNTTAKDTTRSLSKGTGMQNSFTKRSHYDAQHILFSKEFLGNAGAWSQMSWFLVLGQNNPSFLSWIIFELFASFYLGLSVECRMCKSGLLHSINKLTVLAFVSEGWKNFNLNSSLHASDPHRLSHRNAFAVRSFSHSSSKKALTITRGCFCQKKGNTHVCVCVCVCMCVCVLVRL